MEKNILKSKNNKNNKKKVKDKSSSKYMIYYQHIGEYGIDIKEEKYNIETFKNIMNMSDIRYYSIFKKTF